MRNLPSAFRLGLAAVLAAATLLTATANTTPAALRETTKTRIDGAEMYAVGFDKLSAFEYKIVDAGTGATPEEIEAARKIDKVPAWIKVYHDQRVALTGYLMPLQVEKGKAKKFVMMKDVNTCCYGAVPNMNDYVVVTMKGEGVTAVQDVPVVLVGIFKIEEKYDGGYVTALFSMDGEKLLGPKK
jgi:hypothetical protein